MFGISKRPFCVKGGEIIGNIPTIEELAFYIKEYILNDGYSSEWGSDEVKGATRKAVYDMHQTVVGQLEYKGLWDASGGGYPSNPELGWYYVIDVAGEVGGIWYEAGDWIIWNGTGWDKLAGARGIDPIGVQKNYFGLGIKGNMLTRDYEISIVNGDDFDMKGWFVCNGQAGTPELRYRFMRYNTVSGGIGGSNDAVVVEHNHGASSDSGGGHQHTININLDAGVDPHMRVTNFQGGSPEAVHTEGVGGHVHTITVNNEGVSGVGKNMPSYIDSIPIIRMS